MNINDIKVDCNQYVKATEVLSIRYVEIDKAHCEMCLHRVSNYIMSNHEVKSKIFHSYRNSGQVVIYIYSLKVVGTNPLQSLAIKSGSA